MRKLTAIDFWGRVDKTADCWLWTGPLNESGYGVFGRRARAHRVSYELTRGPIPIGLQLDHLCRNRACVNPWHLEPVTLRENLLRGTGIAAQNASKTHCPQGHLYTADNLTGYRPGTRQCRTCSRASARRKYLAEVRRAAEAGYGISAWRLLNRAERGGATFLR